MFLNMKELRSPASVDLWREGFGRVSCHQDHRGRGECRRSNGSRRADKQRILQRYPTVSRSQIPTLPVKFAWFSGTLEEHVPSLRPRGLKFLFIAPFLSTSVAQLLRHGDVSGFFCCGLASTSTLFCSAGFCYCEGKEERDILRVAEAPPRTQKQPDTLAPLSPTPAPPRTCHSPSPWPPRSALCVTNKARRSL